MTTIIEKCPNCGADAVDRSEFWEACPDNGHELEQQLSKIKREINKYYLALDNRNDGGIARFKAFEEIQKILGMQWIEGEVSAFLEKYPKLKPFYEGE